MIWLVIVAGVPFVAAAGFIAMRSPLRYLLPAYAALLPYGTSISTGLHSSFGSLSSALGLLLALGLLAQFWTSRRGAPSIAPSAALWLLFLAVTGASIFWSVAPHVTATEVIILASQVAVYVLLVLSDIDRAALARTENALLAGAFACACYGLAQLTLLGGLPIRDTGPSARFGNGLLGPDNQAAAFLLPLAVALTRLAIRHGLRERLIYAVVTVVLLTGITLTGSRGGLLGVVVTVFLVILLVPQGRSVLVLCSAVSMLGLVVVLTVHPGGVGERQSAQTDSSGRTDIWRVGLSACSDYCLLGSGWGTFPEVYAARLESVPDARVRVRGSAFEAHNIWLLAAVESGFGGLLLMTSGLLLGLRNAWRLPLSARAAPTAGLAGTVLAAFFLSNLEYKFFWFALAFPVLWSNVARRESEAAAPTLDTHGGVRLDVAGAGPLPPLPGPGVLHGRG